MPGSNPGSNPGSPRDASDNIIDISNNVIDVSGNTTPDISLNIPVIVNTISGEIITGEGYEISNQEGTDISGSDVIQTTFDTIDPEDVYDPDIQQNLSHIVETHDDLSTIDSSANILLNEIKSYAQELQCSDFHGKGTIDDYNELFTAASNIVNETKQMELDVDIEGFNEFAAAADDLSDLFNGFILKLQNVSIITDIGFLTNISYALRRVVNLSETFGRFKQTIFSTTAIQLPKSAHETKIVIDGVMDEVNCAMQYIEHFVSPSETPLADADLSAEEKNIIAKSVETIDNWNTLCEYGVTIAMSNDVDILAIQQASTDLKQSTTSLRSASTRLKAKLAAFNII